ncbi:hypothetical protein Tsubulata_022912 [Turnera subulata]|uniref:Uncharacterized protein n=1 Tax=Turnera subulata TaxID=218843 RepID=A0A9Q0FV56_9ROSI|nr:hypothetical protein Tsubulata_022912 [Turnera subulata]
MSMPQGQQPPPVAVIPTSLSTSSQTHGSLGPFIAVLVMIIILGILAVIVGRLCSGRRIIGHGHGQYDMESWAETKCSSCIDGRITHPLPRPSSNNVHAESSPASSTQTHQETKQEEPSPQHPPGNLDS